MLPTLAFVLVTGFILNNGSVSTIVVPGLADENECHKLALKLNTPKHGCFEYRIATPPADVADAVQDELQIDRQTKRSFKTAEAARSAALEIKTRFPTLQVSIYDGSSKSRTVVGLPGSASQCSQNRKAPSSFAGQIYPVRGQG